MDLIVLNLVDTAIRTNNVVILVVCALMDATLVIQEVSAYGVSNFFLYQQKNALTC